ncbi:MAG TPA: response regulator [Opitutus sp.]|nr:response regulator [Opitutus sp.]
MQPTAATKPPVLVVDDEYGPRESIAFTLSSEFAVDTAERAAEALAKLRAKPFSVIVLDIRMPEMDGIRALEEIRKIDPLVSVVMLTGYGTLLTAQQAMIGGANQYLRKPPDVAELIDAVRKQAEATKVRRQQGKLNDQARELNVALKHEIEQNEPHIWQGRASVELVHDLNNPLTVVIGYATLLVDEARAVAARDPERGKRLGEFAGIVEKAAEYCHHLSENWRMASKKTNDYERLDVVAVAREVRQVVFFGEIAVAFDGAAAAYVRGAKFELMRVFQNVYKNALEAGARQLTVTATQGGGRVDIAIADNGSGMDAEQLRRALKGGFSNKRGGTGLGLSICRHLLGAHGATLAITSTPGEGTTVRLSFPEAA